MYTSHQIDCLKKLGIQFLKPASAEMADKPSINVDVNVDAELTDRHIELSEPLLKDLEVLFPQIKVVGNKIHLTPDFVWLIEEKSTRVIATKTQLISAPFEKLTVTNKKQAWAKLQETVKLDIAP